LLPPDFKGDVPTGYILVRPRTYNGYALFRAIAKSSSEAGISNAHRVGEKNATLSVGQGRRIETWRSNTDGQKINTIVWQSYKKVL
jgi:hypothetical protein